MAQRSVNRRRFLQLSGSAVLGSSILAVTGCGSTTPSAPGGGAASSGPVTLRFMSHNILEKPAGEYLQQMVDEFTQQNPGIKVTVESVPNSDVLTKLTTGAQGNNLPDLIDGQNVGVAGFVNLNAAMDITDMVEKAGIKDQYFPTILDGCRTQEGRLMGLPFYSGTDALYYRSDYFEEAGLDPKQPPKTWDDLVATAKKLTNADKGRYGFGFYGKTHFPSRVINFMLNAGPDGELMRLDKATGKYNIHINSADSQKAWQYLVDLHLVHNVTPPNIVEMDYPANVSAFAAGNLAMMLTGPWGAQTFIATNKDIDGKFLVGPHPSPSGAAPILSQGPLVYGIARTTKYPEQAFKFLKWITLDRNVQWNSKAGYGPVVKSALETDEVKNSKYLPTFMQQAQTAVLLPYNMYLKEMSKITDAWGPEWQAALTGGKSVKDATNAAAQKIKDILGDRAELKFPTA